MRKRFKKQAISFLLAGAMLLSQAGLLLAGSEVVLADVAAENVKLRDADFTGDLWKDGIWTVTPSTWDNAEFNYFTYADDQWMTTGEEEGTTSFKFWMQDAGSFTLTQVVGELPAGEYTLTSYVMGSGADVKLTLGEEASGATSLEGYNVWQKITDTFSVEEGQNDVAVGFSVDVAADGWGYLDRLEIAGKSLEGYVVTVSPSSTTATAGDTISFEATVTYNGKEITDLAKAGIYLWWWADSWNSHSDGKSDAAFDNTDSNSGHSLTADVTVPSEGTYYIVAELQDETKASIADKVYTQIDVSSKSVQEASTIVVSTDKTTVTAGETIAFSASVTDAEGNVITDLEENNLQLWWWTDTWNDHTDGNGDAVYSNYDNNSGYSLNADVTFPTAGTYYIVAQIDGYTNVCTTITVNEKVADETGDTPTPVDADIYVERVTGMSDDFITGADVSSYLSIIKSGAKFYDKDGNELDTQGFFDLLAAGGTNYIRIRVWNNPYDAAGNGYGGGNNDLETAKVIGQYATNAGMKVLIDFHYSDFWADPGKQQAPKAWAAMSANEKATAVSEYTTESLKYLLDNGVDVGMVQVGNETTNAICGVSFSSATESACAIFDAGCDAVHAVASEYNTEILAAIHFTNPERSGNYANFAKRLDTYNVSYDVFASSYYPYWHGTIDNLTSVLKNVANTYGKKVMVAETSWAWTLEDGDGHDNTVRTGSNDKDQPYDFSVQGQCNEIRAVAQAVANVGDAGIGLFYWENAWIPVEYAYDEDGKPDESILASNKTKWEANGSGWASSYAGEYDAEDAGKWYGGSAVDNQAWFDFTGKALDTVNIYNYIRTGTNVKPVVTTVAVADTTVAISEVEELALPEKATVSYNVGTETEVEVSWNEKVFEEAKAAGIGSYEINGTVVVDENTYDVVWKLTIEADNLIKNAGFEDGLNEWEVSGFNTSDAASNSRTGNGCLHFYTANAGAEMIASQTITVGSGVYSASAFLQGGNAGESDVFAIEVMVGDKTYTEISSVSGWKVWSNPTIENIQVAEDDTEITVFLLVLDTTAGVWGSYDDAKLIRTGDYVAESGEEETEDVPSTPNESGNSGTANDSSASNNVSDAISNVNNSKASNESVALEESEAISNSEDSSNAENSVDEQTEEEATILAETENVTINVAESDGKTVVTVTVEENSEDVWASIEQAISENIEANDAVVAAVIELKNEAEVPASIFESIAGKNVNLTFDLGTGISWTINGNDVTGVNFASINLQVTRNAGEIPTELISEVAGEQETINISLAHDGEFGFTAVLTIQIDKMDAGKYANLYYFNEATGQLEFMCSSLISEEGEANLTFTHASDYVIVVSDATVVPDDPVALSDGTDDIAANSGNNNSTTNTTDSVAGAIVQSGMNSNMIWLTILLAVAFLVIIGAVAVFARKKKN